MRKFKTGLIAIVASAAMLVPAANAAASTQSVSNTASSSSAGCVLLCFDHFLNGNKVGVDVDILNTVTFCAVDISVLEALVKGEEYDCGGGKKVKRTH